MKSRVTTGNGDGGVTRSIAGEVLPKDHPVMEACGKLDSLRAQTALLRLQLLESSQGDKEELAEFLLWLLHVYFLMGTELNDPKRIKPEYRAGEVGATHLEKVETLQGQMEAGLDLPKSFLVTATNVLAAQCDVLATVARDVERSVVTLKTTVPEFNETHMLKLLNRLSDFYFILGRHVEGGEHQPVDYGVLEG